MMCSPIGQGSIERDCAYPKRFHQGVLPITCKYLQLWRCGLTLNSLKRALRLVLV